MFPLKDNIPSRRFPYVTVFLIGLSAYVFYLELKFGLDFILQYSLIPADVKFSDVFTLTPFVTSIFLHGGWLHLIINMWYLWIFGDNVEDMFGKFFYPVLFIFWGVFAGLFQYFLFPNVDIPNLGASGAVAGVLGSYLVFFPRAKVKSLLFIFFFVTFIEIRAITLLLFWFVIQLFSGFYSITPEFQSAGGVAYFAHIGGFFAGIITALLHKMLKS